MLRTPPRRVVLSWGLTQAQLGVDPTTWRDFVAGKSWPQARSRANIEAHLNWRIGALQRIVEGGDPAHEDIRPEVSAEIPLNLAVNSTTHAHTADDVQKILSIHGISDARKLELIREVTGVARATLPPMQAKGSGSSGRPLRQRSLEELAQTWDDAHTSNERIADLVVHPDEDVEEEEKRRKSD